MSGSDGIRRSCNPCVEPGGQRAPFRRMQCAALNRLSDFACCAAMNSVVAAAMLKADIPGGVDPSSGSLLWTCCPDAQAHLHEEPRDADRHRCCVHSA